MHARVIRHRGIASALSWQHLIRHEVFKLSVCFKPREDCQAYWASDVTAVDEKFTRYSTSASLGYSTGIAP